jgi:hypothetical protein
VNEFCRGVNFKLREEESACSKLSRSPNEQKSNLIHVESKTKMRFLDNLVGVDL